ncbi:MAG: GNAT family N-acetyltransferase [Micromonosporaceae bacterium]|nr:GNAT family N-acetyltransferase [Micromonosporaceae bacterium]
MQELTIRGYAAADAEPLAELFNELTQHAGGRPWAVPAELDSYLATSLPDPARDSRLVLSPDGTLVAAATVTPPPEGGTRSDLLGGVHPDWRGRGLGRRLLSWQLDRAAELGRAAAPDAGWYASTRVEAGDQAAARLFRRFGLTPVRHWLIMVAPTAGVPPEPPLPAGLRVEPYSARWERATHAAHSEAFADHWGFHHWPLAQWVPLSVGSDRFVPELSLLALDRDELAGYVLSYRDIHPDRFYIGQVGVRPPWRRRGLAGALLVRMLSAAGRAGRPWTWLRVDADSSTGAVGVYRRAGFTVESRSVSYATTRRRWTDSPLPA